MIYLLDTNAWITLLRKKSASLSAKVHAANPGDLHLCSIVLAELLFGAHNAPAVHRTQNLFLVSQLRQQFASLPFSDAACAEKQVIQHRTAPGPHVRGCWVVDLILGKA